MENSNIKGLSLKDLITLVFSHLIEIIIIMIVFTIVGYVYTMNFVKPQYTSSTTLVLVSKPKMQDDTTKDDSITDSDINLNSKLVSTYSEIITSKAVLRQVKNTLDLDVEEEYIKKKIKVTAVKDSGVLEISVSFNDSETAAEIANEIAKEFVKKNEELYKIDNVKVLDEAEPDDEPSNINHKKDIALFMFLGLNVSIAYVWLFNLLDTTIKSTDDLERKYKVPVLASVPLYTTSSSKKKGDA